MSYYPSRLLCTVLDEMRECFKTYNFSPILGLIEEAQILADRMEAGLQDKSQIKDSHKRIKKLEALREKLREEVKELEDKLGKTGKERSKETISLHEIYLEQYGE